MRKTSFFLLLSFEFKNLSNSNPSALYILKENLSVDSNKHQLSITQLLVMLTLSILFHCKNNTVQCTYMYYVEHNFNL